MISRTIIGVIAVLVLCSNAAFASEDFTFFGGLQKNGAGEAALAGQMEFMKDLSLIDMKPVFLRLSISTFQEGHFQQREKHSRDGFTGQIWGQYPLATDWSVGVGAGAYLFYDTLRFGEKMGFAPIVSAEARHNITEHWFLKLRTNFVLGTKNDTQTILVGAGRDITLTSETGAAAEQGNVNNEIGILAGSSALKAEYRRSLPWRHIEATIAHLVDYDGRNNGSTVELWLVERVFDGSTIIGIGAGPYYSWEDSKVSSVVSVGARHSLQFLGIPAVNALLQWDRIHTKVDRDVVSFGLGLKF